MSGATRPSGTAPLIFLIGLAVRLRQFVLNDTERDAHLLIVTHFHPTLRNQEHALHEFDINVHRDPHAITTTAAA